jgi:hypothetical protein
VFLRGEYSFFFYFVAPSAERRPKCEVVLSFSVIEDSGELVVSWRSVRHKAVRRRLSFIRIGVNRLSLQQ